MRRPAYLNAAETRNHAYANPGRTSEVDVCVGRRIRERRKELKLTGRELGALIGVSGEQISNYERGEIRIAAARLYQLSVILKLPINAFFEDVSANPDPGYPVAAPQEKTSAGLANPRKHTSEAEVIAKLGRLASRIPDPVLRASVREILRELPVFKPSVEPGETGVQDEGTARGDDSSGNIKAQAQESLAPSRGKKRNLVDRRSEPKTKRSGRRAPIT